MAGKSDTRDSLAARRAGVCLHVSSLPGSYGIGEIGQAARTFIDNLQRMKLGTWQFLPLGPTAFGDSPYQPLSTFAGNEMLIDTGELIAAGLLTQADASPLTGLPRAHVDFGRLVPAKAAVLKRAAGRFRERASEQMAAGLESFVARHDATWLHDYALFRVLKNAHDGRPWPQWEPGVAQRNRRALRRVQKEFARDLADIKIAQFLFHEQWQRLHEYAKSADVQLFGDMPIYIAMDSADAWSHPELLQLDDRGRPASVAGVPPDYFSEDGQLWGNPLYDWPAHAATRYHWWTQRLRASLQQADLVRIDHFRGFEAYWAVPAGAGTARAGSWQPGPGDALFDALQGALGSLPVVAEDLGLITDEVIALRDRHALPGMVVLQFSVPEDDFRLDSVSENSVCYTGTHDNDTTLGWFHGSPDDNRPADDIRRIQEQVLAFTGNGADTVVNDLIRAVYASPARLAMVPMQDYLGLGSGARMNTPGTSINNWRWRFLESQVTGQFCKQIADNVEEFQREASNEQ